jgi:hypothetical protein
MKLAEPESERYDEQRPDHWDSNDFCHHPRLAITGRSKEAEASPDQNKEHCSNKRINEADLVAFGRGWKGRTYERRERETTKETNRNQNLPVGDARPKLYVFHALTFSSPMAACR